MGRKFKVELGWDTIENIIVSTLKDDIENFKLDLEKRKKGTIGSAIFEKEKKKDIAEIKRHIDALNTVVKYYGIPE